MKKRKNILLISLDDAFSYWRFKNIFSVPLKTPNLDRICEVSSAFTSAYCQIPICGPSRSSFMSGLSPYETGCFDNYDSIFNVLSPEQMWQYRLKQNGYYCSTAGKIHHGYKPLPDHIHKTLYSHPSSQVYFGPKLSAEHKKFGGALGGAGTTNEREDRQYYDSRSANHAVRFLQSWDNDTKPFYREVGFHHPHPPLRTPVRFKEMYNPEDFTPPDDWAKGADICDFPKMFMPENINATGDLPYWQKTVRNYFSALTHADHHIGRVWDALKASKHANNTVVIILSDHGYHVGDKNRLRKFTLWEEATPVPLIIHDPDEPSKVIDDPVTLLDVGPTVLDYTQSRPMQHSVGRSLKPLVEGGANYNRAAPTFWYGSAAIRYGDYRTTLYQDGSSEFYNVKTDPWLTKNIASTDEKYSEHYKKLIETCKEYGSCIVSEKSPQIEVNHYLSVMKDMDIQVSPPTSGVFCIGNAELSDWVPGYRKHLVLLKENDTIKVPNTVRNIMFASDHSGNMDHLKIECNDLGNRLYFFAGQSRFTLEVFGGSGDDQIITQNEKLIAHLGSGKTFVQAGTLDSKIYASTGQDTIELIAGNNILHAGLGDTTVHGGAGNDTIYTGQGTNVIYTGEGDNHIIVEGGINTISLGEGDNKITFKRTGNMQTIGGGNTCEIDISDWIDCDISYHQDGENCILTSGNETLCFLKKTIDEIKKL